VATTEIEISATRRYLSNGMCYIELFSTTKCK